MIDIYATLARIIFVPRKTLAEECLDEIAAEEKQPMERGAGVHDQERHPTMGLEEFKQACGRNQRGPGSEGTPSTETTEGS